MDLRHLDTEATPHERRAVDAVVPPGEPPRRWAEVVRRRAFLLPALHALQDAVGHVSEGGLGYVCRRLHVAPAEAYGVATFYHLFTVGERPGPRGARLRRRRVQARRCGGPRGRPRVAVPRVV
jgi:NADH-quinone oxidoreductase subunit F